MRRPIPTTALSAAALVERYIYNERLLPQGGQFTASSYSWLVEGSLVMAPPSGRQAAHLFTFRWASELREEHRVTDYQKDTLTGVLMVSNVGYVETLTTSHWEATFAIPYGIAELQHCHLITYNQV